MDLLNSAQVAKLLNVPVGTIRYWRHVGTGPESFRLGGRAVRYRRATVEAWVRDQEDGSHARRSA